MIYIILSLFFCHWAKCFTSQQTDVVDTNTNSFQMRKVKYSTLQYQDMEPSRIDIQMQSALTLTLASQLKRMDTTKSMQSSGCYEHMESWMVGTPRKWETERESCSIYSLLLSGKEPAQLTEQNPLKVRRAHQLIMAAKYLTIIIIKTSSPCSNSRSKANDHNWTSM